MVEFLMALVIVSLGSMGFPSSEAQDSLGNLPGPWKPPITDCASRGGVKVGFNCYCVLEDVYLESQQTCMTVQLAKIEQFKSNGSCYVRPVGHAAEFPKQFSTERFCANPAKELCNPNTNPAMVLMHEHEKRYQQTIYEVEQEMIEKVKALTNGRSKYCWQVRGKKFDECMEQSQLLLSERIWDDEKFAVADQVFQKAKENARAYLLKLKNSFRGRNRETVALKNQLEAMHAKIKDIPLEFSPEAREYAAAAKTESLFCSIHGMVHVVADVPWTGGQVFTHEFGHFIDRSLFLGIRRSVDDVLEYESKSNPFNKVLECLGRVVQTADVTCIEKAVQSEKNTEKRAAYETTLKNLKVNPYYSYTGPIENNGQVCRNNQVFEAFGDWFGIEANVDAMMSAIAKGTPALQLLQQMTAINCSHYLNNLVLQSLNPEMEETTSIDPHPTGEVRINKILMAHPKIRAAMGCPGQSNEGQYCAFN